MFPDGNYFALQPLIQERLIDQIGDIFTPDQIHSGFDLGSIRDGTISYPSVFVVYMQDDGVTSAQNSVAELVTQRWQIILAVRNVENPRDSGPIMAEAGLMIHRIIKAMKGWRPYPDWTPFYRVPGEKTSYPDKGLAFFPVEFLIKTSLE